MVHFCAAFICLLNDIGDERRHHEIYLSDPRHFADAFHAGIFKEVGNIDLPPGAQKQSFGFQAFIGYVNVDIHPIRPPCSGRIRMSILEMDRKTRTGDALNVSLVLYCRRFYCRKF